MIKLLANALFMSTPLILGACGEVVAERTGMMVTAVEGIFLFGAWGGFVGAYFTKSLLLGFLAAIACGVLVALLYAVTTIHMQQNQVVMGTAVNILMTGICEFFYRVIFGTPLEPLTVKPLPVLPVPLLADIPVLGTILFRQNLITYLTWILVPAVLFLLYKTSLGLTLRSTGENPEAVDVAGIRVSRVRLLAVLFAGILGGIAGAYYSIGDIGMYTTSIISGRGWIAFAICFLGNWNPLLALGAGVVFGTSDAVGVYVKSLGSGFFPSELFTALPYILTILLTVVRRRFNAPAKLGTAYVKEH